MTYFLPSYFQKRLLRYALSRLDFLESDALDLDNLAFTIGQRSVVELKNVGIQVSKVVERLKLPAALVPQHASIRLIRITIPADLHVSGIEIEIDGINIEVDLDASKTQDDGNRTSSSTGKAPSHKDIVNQPRICSSTTHDPGGAPIIPSSQDLAASFLQAEPDQEKRELQAAVESRSVYVQQSSASLESSTSDMGYGSPEGFSLPGFVATFFTGVADRLSVRIQNVVVTLSTYILDDQATREPLQFTLRIEELELQGIKSMLSTGGDLDLRRALNISGIEFLISSQGDLLSQKSAVSSPKLSKTKSSNPTFSRQESLMSSITTRRSEPQGLPDLGSSRASTASSRAPALGLGVEDSMLESSQLFDPSLAHTDYMSPDGSAKSDDLSPIEPRSHSASFSRRQSRSSFGSPNEHPLESEDLTQSRFFSHEDAESMYMSALSEALPAATTPLGGSILPVELSPRSSKSESAPETMSQPVDEVQADQKDARADNRSTDSVGHAFPEEQPGIPSPRPRPINQCSKRLLRINEVQFKFPVKAPEESNTEEQRHEIPPDTRGSFKGHRASHTVNSMSASHARAVSETSVYGISGERKVDVEDNISYQASLGDVEFALDMSMCHVLLKSFTQSYQVFSPPNRPAEATTTRTKPTNMHLKLFVRSIALNLMEIVPDYTPTSRQQAPTESTFSVRDDDVPLLQLQLLKLQLSAVIREGKLDQKLSISRFALYRESEKILSFFDPVSLQDSVVASSIVLEPDDITIRQIDNRIDISTKPLRIALDLVVLDDVLSRSGGLSSLLELGNSVASAKENEQRASAFSTRRRSVRFDDAAVGPEPQRQSGSGLKLNVRISGALLDLIGSQSSMQVKSSSVKLVYRSGKLRANISSVSLKGPIVRGVPSNDLVNLRLGDIQLVYLNTPGDDDLDRLLQLLVPSKEKYEEDDDIMVDTLLRQRRKGGVMQLTIQQVELSVSGLAWTQRLTQLGEEISKLSTVTKYLPEDDRPGILTFALITKLTVRLELVKGFGPLSLKANLLEGAHISVPSLMAAQVSSFNVSQGRNEAIVRELIPDMQESVLLGPPMLMCRFIADEMEPTVKVKLSNACFEYSVPALLSLTQLAESVQKELSNEQQPFSPRASEISVGSSENSELSRKVKLSVALHNSAVSLHPLESPANALFVFTDSVITHSAKQHTTVATVEIKKASIMIIDDVSRIGHGTSGADPKLYFDQNDHVQQLVKSGFVPVGSISAAVADIKMAEDKMIAKQYLDVELRNSLLFLETCADSTQTLIQILGALSPPSVPSKTAKFRTEIIPLSDMLASFTGNAFVSEAGPELGLQIEDEAENTPTPSTLLAGRRPAADRASSSDDEDEAFMNDLYLSQAEDTQHDQMTESSIMSASSTTGSVHVAPVSMTADDEHSASGSIVMHSMIDLRDGHFVHKTSVGGTAHRWDSTRNTYGMGSETSVQQSPLKVRVRDVHIIWNLFDGYDWPNTRDVITQAVRDVEDKAIAKQRRRESHRSPGPEEDDESVVGDVLFNSIYISIPTNRDPRELTNAINMELGDAASETGSYATSTTTTAASTKRYSGPRYKPKRLKLNRSKQHKMTFELEGIAADFLAFPPGSGEVESSIDIRVRKVEVFDHIPTSTWKKFATYMHEAGEREVGTDMVHVELLNVKPVAELAASEMVMKLTVLPLRLHVDQDALDFLTRFFEFKDDRTPPSTTPSTPPFLQRAEVNPIRLRLDFKPKRVDYAGLKSGRTTEFMNFFILDRADMVLRRVIVYGVSGFDRLGIMLNNIWTPDVRNNQLPGVLAGLAPVRSLVDVGSGVRDLVAVPVREYKKDGRIVRSIQKGALAFAKTTTTELVNLGAKLAIGTQTVLQNAEGVLAPQNKPQSGFGSDSDDDEGQKQISHYADQPLGIVQGLRGAYASLERDLLLAKDAIVAVPGEIMADGSATGAAKVVLKQSPTIILRPAIGVTKALGQAFLGAGNTLDPGNRRRIEDKYKRY